MRKLFNILALLTAIVAVILSVLPLSNLAFIPSALALVFGLIAFYLSKQKGQSKKVIQLAFILTIIALCFTVYKAIYNKVEVTNTEELESREKASEEDAIEELENLELESIDFDD